MKTQGSTRKAPKKKINRNTKPNRSKTAPRTKRKIKSGASSTPKSSTISSSASRSKDKVSLSREVREESDTPSSRPLPDPESWGIENIREAWAQGAKETSKSTGSYVEKLFRRAAGDSPPNSQQVLGIAPGHDFPQDKPRERGFLDDVVDGAESTRKGVLVGTGLFAKKSIEGLGGFIGSPIETSSNVLQLLKDGVQSIPFVGDAGALLESGITGESSTKIQDRARGNISRVVDGVEKDFKKTWNKDGGVAAVTESVLQVGTVFLSGGGVTRLAQLAKTSAPSRLAQLGVAADRLGLDGVANKVSASRETLTKPKSTPRKKTETEAEKNAREVASTKGQVDLYDDLKKNGAPADIRQRLSKLDNLSKPDKELKAAAANIGGEVFPGRVAAYDELIKSGKAKPGDAKTIRNLIDDADPNVDVILVKLKSGVSLERAFEWNHKAVENLNKKGRPSLKTAKPEGDFFNLPGVQKGLSPRKKRQVNGLPYHNPADGLVKWKSDGGEYALLSRIKEQPQFGTTGGGLQVQKFSEKKGTIHWADPTRGDRAFGHGSSATIGASLYSGMEQSLFSGMFT